MIVRRLSVVQLRTTVVTSKTETCLYFALNRKDTRSLHADGLPESDVSVWLSDVPDDCAKVPKFAQCNVECSLIRPSTIRKATGKTRHLSNPETCLFIIRIQHHAPSLGQTSS
jgi:hypothetical protein